MSKNEISVHASVTIFLEYDEFTMDADQALLLWEKLGQALGKSLGDK